MKHILNPDCRLTYLFIKHLIQWVTAQWSCKTQENIQRVSNVSQQGL